MRDKPYLMLAIAVTVHFFVMWALTYVGIAALDHAWLNLNRFYMAVVMVAPMAMVMLAVMGGMFPKRGLNIAIYAVSLAVFVTTFAAIRAQALVGDEQLSRSMIPHHSIAIKNCERADLDDPESVRLCEQIVETQREEIAQMERILARLEGAD